MGDSGDRDTFTSEDAFAVLRGRDDPHAPLTASEAADALGCARRTAYNKLMDLVDGGALRTKKVGARGRVWWLPAGRGDAAEIDSGDDGDGVDHNDGGDRSVDDDGGDGADERPSASEIGRRFPDIAAHVGEIV